MKNALSLLLIGACGALLLRAVPRAQSGGVFEIRVKEPAGIRRTTYPAGTKVTFAKGALTEPGRVRLLSAGKEVPAQYGVEASWPDGSIQRLTVDFNVSLGPFEEAPFRLEYGDTIKSEVVPNGLTVTEDAGGIQVGRIRLSTTGAPLFLSVKYRKEDIGQGQNGFAIVDTTGTSRDAASAEQVRVQVVKRGPLMVEVRYSGELRLTGNYMLGYATTVEMPNSKSWAKVTTAVIDPQRRVRELSFHTPLALGAQPWTWDHGTGSWSYGLLRSPTESVTLSQIIASPQATKWEIRSGVKGQEQAYEVTGGRRPKVAEGWGHIQDQQEAVAFAMADFGAEAGTYSITLDGSGQTSFRFAPARSLPYLRLTVYEHFVSMPVPVGAVTSPVSMLNPLVVALSNPR